MSRKIATTVLFDQEDMDILEEEQRRTGKSLSALIRDAIRKVYGSENR